jgi:heptosyltransferase-2
MVKGCENCIYYNPVLGNVLLVEAGGLGSILRTSVVSKEIKNKHPNFRIQWLTHEGGAELLQHIPSVDGALITTPETLYVLEAQRFDTVINFESLPIYLALTAKLKAEKKFGFTMSDIGNLDLADNTSANLLRWQTDDYYRQRLNTKSVQRLLIEACGYEWSDQNYDLITRVDDDEKINNLVRQHIINYSEKTRFVGLNIGSSLKHNAKRWDPKKYYELAQKINSDDSTNDVEFFILAGPEEVVAYEEIKKMHTELGLKTLHLLGREQSVSEFLSLIKRCDIVISADTFGMHAAIGLNKRVISLHGPQPQQEILLSNDSGAKIHLNLECSPCFAGQNTDCPNKVQAKCMTDIQVGQVAEVLSKELYLLNK